MGKEHAETRSKALPSQIPVIAPRPSQSSLPSSLSTPQLGLVPPTRHLAVSGTPAPTSGQNAPAAGAAGGLTSFRSFRNLLSFGPSKSHASIPVPVSSGVMRPFVGLRRSTQAERSPRMSTSQPPDEQAQDDLPVLSIEMAHTIELSHRVDEPLIDSEELQKQLGLRPQTPDTLSISPTSSSATSINTLDPPTTPSGLGMSELSTIMEAETSGLSQHLQFDESRDDIQLPLFEHGRLLKNVASGPLLRAVDDEELRVRRSRETSPLDLSTSQVSSEVLAALSGPESQGWLHSVVVEDKPPPRVAEEESDNGDVSFSLGAVDPELAALLSPNRASPSPSRSPASGYRMPLPPSPLKPALELETPLRAPPATPPATSAPSSLPTPIRRSTSVARPSIPRLVRSASECPQPRTSVSTPLSSPARPATAERTSPKATSSRPSLQLYRPSPPSPSADTHLPRRPTSGGRDSKPRRSAISRLVTPARHLTTTNNGRGAFRPNGSPSSPNFGADEQRPSRGSSVIDSGRRGALHRPSLDDSASTRAPSRLSTRERATSLGESTSYHPSLIRPTDWLGPRTAKAFAAAGLLDTERDGTPVAPSVSRPGSRFAPSRSERDFRSQYAPSRAGFSDVGSRASWGRRSGSISEVLSSQGAESASTPRTAFSAASTAPTSISATSSSSKHLQSELQLLQDRHSLETGALLNALADSQRTTKVLREENVQLRDQIQRLEFRLAETLDELRRMQLAPPP